MNKLQKLYYTIKHPKHIIRNKVQQEVDRILRELNYQPINEFNPDKDIFVVSYPKSGATWMQCLMTGLLLGMDTRYLSDKLTHEIYPDIHMKSYYKRFYEFNFFKTHNLPKPEYKNVIYIVRDGRDALVSYYNMNKTLGIDVTLEEMVIEGKSLFPSPWHIHVRQWINNPYQANILYIKYEDLIYQPEQQLKRIMDFTHISRDENIVKQIIEGCSFQQMKNKEQKWGSENKNWPKDKSFFRKGKIGTFKQEMPGNLIEIFEKNAGEELKHWGYELFSNKNKV